MSYDVKRYAGLCIVVLLCNYAFYVVNAAASDSVFHDITIRLDPHTGSIEGEDRINMTAASTFSFSLAPSLKVEKVWIDNREVEFKKMGLRWIVETKSPGASEIVIHYAGELPSVVNTDSPLGPRGAIMDEQGAYLPAASGWLPTTRHEWVQYRLTVDVPLPYRAVATGQLRDEFETNGRYRAVFATDYPSAGPSVFVGPYTISELNTGAIRIRTYFHFELTELAEDYLQAAARYLERFSKLIGPYAYSDFHLISAPVPVGLSYPNLTYVGREVLRLPYMRGRSLAHEVLHSWWGNGVYVDYTQGNWSEGLTTYLADYGLIGDDPEKAREMRLLWLRDYAALPATRDAPAAKFKAKFHDADQVIGYNKIAFMFHMLRLELGDTDFVSALQDFWRDHRFDIAGWDDLRSSFERTSNRDLGDFFIQWLQRASAPRLHLLDAHAAEDGNKIHLKLAQDSPPYRLNVPIRVDTAHGPERHSVLLDKSDLDVDLELHAPAVAVTVDPDYDLFRHLEKVETPPIFRDITLSESTLSVLAVADSSVEQAAQTLLERLMDAGTRLVDIAHAAHSDAPLLVIGTRTEVAQILTTLGLASMPASVAGRGTASVWTQRRENGETAMIVAADDAAAINALVRPLPHYGRKSYLVFEGRRAAVLGVWEVKENPLFRSLGR